MKKSTEYPNILFNYCDHTRIILDLDFSKKDIINISQIWKEVVFIPHIKSFGPVLSWNHKF